MREKKDFPRGNFSSIYCADCVDARGVLKRREIIRVNMIRRRIRSHGLNLEEAAELVDNLMKSMPLWNGKGAPVS
jgi:hypothetical protein